MNGAIYTFVLYRDGGERLLPGNREILIERSLWNVHKVLFYRVTYGYFISL